MNYKILDTETTRNFCSSLIGTIGKIIKREEIKVESGLTAPYWQEYIYLDTLDGELMFLENELEKVI